MRLRTHLIGVFALFATVFLSRAADAQVLADKVPADSVIYVGWIGSQSMGPAFAASNFKAFLDQSQVPDFIERFIPQVLDRLAKEQPGAKEPLAMFRAIGGPMWRHPSAFFIANIDTANPDLPVPHLGILCDAGNEAEQLHQQLQDIVRQAAGAPFPIRLVRVGDLVAVTVGYERGEDAIGAGKGLLNNADFSAALDKVSKNGVITGYVNVEKALANADELLRKQLKGDDLQNWNKAKDVLGLDGIKRLIWSHGFAGKDWETSVWLNVPSPRKGLLPQMIIGQPLSNDIFAVIPQNATMAGAGSFNLAGLVSGVRGAIEQVEPSAKKDIDEMFQQISQTVGVDVEKDFLGSLGNEWAYYVDPSVIGRGMLGTTVVNHLKNADTFEQSLSKLEQFANQMLAEQLKQEGATVAFRQTSIGGIPVHYLAIPIVTPSWVIKDGNLYLALYPQVAAAAAQHVNSKGKSILDNQSFVALRSRLGGGTAPGSMSFIDLPKVMPDSYAVWVAIARLDGFGDVFGIPSPPALLPPLNKLMPILSPAGVVTWTDAEGAHLHALSPFPASEMLATDPMAMSVPQQAMMVSILLPALNRAREQANRVKSASNLRQIGLGAIMYANAQPNEALPPDLGTMMKEQDLTVELFSNPRRNDSVPANIAAGTREQQKAWATNEGDYLWFGAGKKNNLPSNAVLAAEKPDGLTDGLNILFGDGHVEFVIMPRAMEMIEAAKTGGKP